MESKLIARFANFSSVPQGWTTWTPRAELTPAFGVDAKGGREGGSALKITTRSAASIGAWRTRIGNVTAGKPYRVSVDCRCEGVKYIPQSVSLRLNWQNRSGQRARNADNAIPTVAKDGWYTIDYCSVAPEGASSLLIELELRWAAGGTAWFDRLEVSELEELPKKLVRLATVFLRPRDSKSPADSVAAFWRLAQAHASEKPDLLCLPEGITVVGTNKSYVDVAESIPGPTTETLKALAKQIRSHIVAGIYEREGPIVYNTSVLVSPAGQLIGKYRKTHLPQEEVEGGITPGDSYPVFDTDLGKVGMFICWDLQFPECARAMAVAGAQILALPIWGGSEVLARGRAIENHIFLVSSTYDMKSFIVDPMGQVLAEATKEKPFALAEVDLLRPIYQPWLSDMRWRTWKERRADLASSR